MTARSLLIGLDGADLDLVLALGRARLPTLHCLMDRGVFAACRSVRPPATLPNWTTLLTGADPGEHGVFDFTTRVGYGVRFTAGTVRELPTIMTRLDRTGKRCACVGFPATWPPEQLDHGVFISGWDAPVAFESDASFVWPQRLHADIVTRFGPQRFDDVDELNADADGWHERLPAALCDRIDRKVELAQWLLADRPWDLFAFYFGESDTAAHHLWSLHDPRSPRHPGRDHNSDGLARVYQRLDAAVGALIASAGGDDVEVTIVSDHGFGGSSDKVLHLNRVLAAHGLLQFHAPRWSGRAARMLKHTALTQLPPKLRERVFRAAGAALPGWLESRARFGAIDMSRTQAFSDELNYFPAIHLNVKGREPQGTVDPHDRSAVTTAVRDALLALRDPWSGKPVVASVHAREDIFHGPHVARAPDLLLELHLDDGYSYNLMPSPIDGGDQQAWRRLHVHELLGRKGRSLAGSHRDHGIFIGAGPQVTTRGRIEIRIADATSMLLRRLDAGAGVPLVHAAATTRDRAAADESRVAARLRALGYIE